MLKFIDKTDVFRALDAKLHEELKWSNPVIYLKTWQDMTMWSWSKFAPQMRALREESQSVSLLLGFRKR